jgi:hypothetical protein
MCLILSPRLLPGISNILFPRKCFHKFGFRLQPFAADALLNAIFKHSILTSRKTQPINITIIWLNLRGNNCCPAQSLWTKRKLLIVKEGGTYNHYQALKGQMSQFLIHLL